MIGPWIYTVVRWQVLVVRVMVNVVDCILHYEYRMGVGRFRRDAVGLPQCGHGSGTLGVRWERHRFPLARDSRFIGQHLNHHDSPVVRLVRAVDHP